MINLCEILEFVTEKKNILHLDIKPENIMVTKYGKELVLIDFGRSKRITKADRFAVSDLAKVNYNDNESIEKMYQYGLGTDENLEQAAEWFSKAAAKEHKYALYSLGMLYLQGKGVEQDEETAYSLLFRSYSKGNPYAAYELGKLYETGCGTEKNQEKSENCYRVAFLGFLNLEKRSKDDTLWYRIGCMYLHGIGTEADETKAEHYLTKASDYGNTHASYQLARLYIRQESQKLSGESGTAPDYAKIAKAVKWLEESAAQENPFADYAIGRLYREGTLVAEDMEKAVFHLKRAANARNSYAQYQLGKIYLEEDTKKHSGSHTVSDTGCENRKINLQHTG